MTHDGFSKALRRKYEQITPSVVPPELDAAIREGIARKAVQRRRRRVALRLGVVGALAAGAAAIAWVLLPSAPGRSTEGAVGPFAVRARSPEARLSVQPDGTVHVARGECTLFDGPNDTTLRLSRDSRIRKRPTGLEVVAGVVAFEVARRPPGAAPLRISVSGGAIEVVGTRFEVVQGEAAGSVRLDEGTIRFVDLQGRVTTLAPGETHAWGGDPPAAPPATPPPPPATQEAPPPRPKAAPAATRPEAVPPREAASAPAVDPAVEAEDVLARVAALRSRNRYEEAVEELARASAAPYSSETLERLSFERGAILTYVVKDPRRACAHWREHERRFPSGRYDTEIARALAVADCAGPGAVER